MRETKGSPAADGTADGADREVIKQASDPNLKPVAKKARDPWAPQRGGPPDYLRGLKAARDAPPPDTLPYGVWACADCFVLFDRDYVPLWVRSFDGTVTRADPNAWIVWKYQIYLHTDADPPRRDRATRERLAQFLADFIGETGDDGGGG